MNYESLKAIIAQNIYTNGNNAITAAMVKTAMDEAVNTLGAGYQYMGIAHPGDAAVAYDQHVFFIATEVGTYTNKGGHQVAEGEVAILKYDTAWTKEVTGAASAASVTELGQKVTYQTMSDSVVAASKIDFSVPMFVGFRYSIHLVSGSVNWVAYLMKDNDNSTARQFEPDYYGQATTIYTEDDLSVGRNKVRFYCVSGSDSVKIMVKTIPFSVTEIEPILGNGRSYIYHRSNLSYGEYINFPIPAFVGGAFTVRNDKGVSFVTYLMKNGDNSTARQVEPDQNGVASIKFLPEDVTALRDTLRFYPTASGTDVTISISWSPFVKNTPRTLSILGDSFSAFPGYIPDGYDSWYPNGDNNVADVTELWWWIFGKKIDCRIGKSGERNNSFSGTCICKTTRPGQENVSFVDRIPLLEDADLVIIEGGTNDNNIGVSMGSYKYSDWTAEDLLYFRPALAYVLDYAKKHLVGSRIVFMLNDGLSSDINDSVETICIYYGIELLKLKNLDKQNGHPSVIGQAQIAEQLLLIC